MKYLPYSAWQLALLVIYFLCPSMLLGQIVSIEQRVFLLGNFTDITDKEGFINKLDHNFSSQSGAFSLILTGDLVDELIEKQGNDAALLPIFQLISMVGKYPNGQLILVPGDRDWNDSRRGGERSVQNLGQRVKAFAKDQKLSNIFWPIEDGCPGPGIVEAGHSLAIITLNSQWWNHPFDKPKPTDALCKALSPENLKEEIEDALGEYSDRNVLLVAHHPIYSLGNYGGYFSAVDQLLAPIPIVSSFRTAYHANAGNVRDLSNPRLEGYSDKMKNTLFFKNNLIYASGHEKNQQIIQQGRNYLVNSGAPEKSKYAAKDYNTIFNDRQSGLIELRYYNSGEVEAIFIKNTPESLVQTHNFILFYPACDTSFTQTIHELVNTAYAPCKSLGDLTTSTQLFYPFPKKVAAGPAYDVGLWKRFWFGNHYRSTWTMPIEVPYLNLDTTFGGLTVNKKGGGRQTTSLKFKAANGAAYTFRSVDKDPAKALNYRLRPTFIAEVLRDQTSTQHPYGAMIVSPLLDKIGILHATPRLFILPNDPKLGVFQKEYGNLLGMLEESPGQEDNEGRQFFGADDVVKSTDMFKKMYEEQKHKVALDEFVRARLFDIWIGDWSKHEDNWKWAMYKQDGKRYYRPVPRDRDHAFSRQDGVLNWLADRRFGVLNIENFGYKVPDILSLTYQPRHMDRFLANEADKQLFMKEAAFIQANITDADIENAVRSLPTELYRLSGEEVESKLKKRLNDMATYAQRYYRLLAKEVDVVGTTEKEFFEVERNADGSLLVKMYNAKAGEKGQDLLYQRTFLPSETNEVRLWGLAGNDIFQTKGDGPGKIKLRAMGGPGDDVFDDLSPAKTLLYDKGNNTEFKLGGGGKVVKDWDGELYEFDRLRFDYDHFMPLFFIGYDKFSGVGFNAGLQFTRKKFTKRDYASKHSFRAGFTLTGNKYLSYRPRFHHVFRKWDVDAQFYYSDPDFYNYFFGVGNDTEKDEDLFKQDFYEAKVSRANMSLGLLRDFLKKSQFRLGIGIEQNDHKVIQNTILEQDSLFGVHEKLMIVPVVARLDLDFRDEKGLPFRGSRALVSYYNGTVTNFDNENFGIFTATLEQYFSNRVRHPITLGLRLGGAKGHGNIPWYKLPTLGNDNGLRGYFENRFAGKSLLFFNSELRYQFANTYTAVVPIKAGVKVFYDRGRVYQEGEELDKDWQQGYGFGFYLTPLDENYTISISFSFSEEESVYPVFSFGTPLR